MERATLLILLPSLLYGVGTGDQTMRRREAVQHYRSGQRALQAEVWDEAEREFREAVRLDPLLASAHYGLGQVYMGTRRYAEAVVAYRACREAFHADDSAHLMDNKAAEERLEDQIQALKDQVRLLQSGRTTTVNPAVTIQRLEDQVHDLERRRHRAGSEPQATPPGVSLALGSALFRTGAMEEAEREYLAVLKVNPNQGEAHNNLAVVYMLTGRLDEAEQAVARAEKAGFRVNPKLKQDIEARKAPR